MIDRNDDAPSAAERGAYRVHHRRIADDLRVHALAVWYVHPDGFIDPRDPSPRIIVGPILSLIGGVPTITVTMTTEEIASVRTYRYQQKQIGGPSK